MNSKQISFVTLTACGLAVLAAGCCCPQPKPTVGIPRIISQPGNRETGTNVTAQLEVQVSAADKGKVKFFWFREVPVLSCMNCPGLKTPEDTCDGVFFDWQDRRSPSSWNSNILTIENTSTDDEGFYGCVITPLKEGLPVAELSTRTRPAYLKVFQVPATKFHPFNFMSTQVASRTLRSQPPGTYPQLCNMDCNVYNEFQLTDQQKVFTNSVAGQCVINVDRIVNGAVTHLLNTQFTVMAVEVDWIDSDPYPSSRTNCTTNSGTTNRVFQAKAKTSYFFYFGAKNAPALANYVLTAKFL